MNYTMHAAQTDYALIDSGNGRKLEQVGPVMVDRPCSQAVWEPSQPGKIWQNASARFVREDSKQWEKNGKLPHPWHVSIGGLHFIIKTTDFGHLGVFPEHAAAWQWMSKRISESSRQLNVLNLFAYSGAATLAAARAGAKVCHVDASKKVNAWARENAALNELSEKPVRWITDDVFKFLKREKRRESYYDGIILDPPSFGRGSRGEIFKIDEGIVELLAMCTDVLTPQCRFLILTCHTPGYTPIGLTNLLRNAMQDKGGSIDAMELVLSGDDSTAPVPSGVFAGWYAE